MTYQINGLNPGAFAPLFKLDEAELSALGALRAYGELPTADFRVASA